MAKGSGQTEQVTGRDAVRARTLRAKELLSAIELAETTGKIRFLKREISGLELDSIRLISSAEQIKSRLRRQMQQSGEPPAAAFIHRLSASFRAACSRQADKLDTKAGENSAKILKLQFELDQFHRSAAGSLEKRDSCSRAAEALDRADFEACRSSGETELEEIIASRRMTRVKSGGRIAGYPRRAAGSPRRQDG